MLKKVILSTVMASSAMTSVNALEFNDKFYGKANVKIGYNHSFYSINFKETNGEGNEFTYGERNNSHGINAGIGFDIFFKATNNIHPFAGLEANGNYMFKGVLKYQKTLEFNQFFNTNARLGVSIKVNKDLSINPYGLVGFNITRFKYEVVTGIIPAAPVNISDKQAAFGYFLYNWFNYNAGVGKLPTFIYGENMENLFKEKITVFSNKETYTIYDDVIGTNKVNEKASLSDAVSSFADLHVLEGASTMVELFKRVNNYLNNTNQSTSSLYYWSDGNGTYVIYNLNDAEIKDNIVEEWKNNADQFGGTSFLDTGKKFLLERKYVRQQSDFEVKEERLKSKVGLNVGAGVEFVIKERFIAGVEYKFSQLKMYGLNIPTHSVALRLGVQFL